MTMEISLTRGKVAIVDADDYEYLSQFNWHAQGGPKRARSTFYAARNGLRSRGEPRGLVWMHCVILPLPDGRMPDHVNGNGLDNRKANLRPSTNQQNHWNMKKPSSNTSGFKGVTWHSIGKRWQARIRIDGRKTHLGLFDRREDAARAYDAAAIKHFGQFARPNFPQPAA